MFDGNVAFHNVVVVYFDDKTFSHVELIFTPPEIIVLAFFSDDCTYIFSSTFFVTIGAGEYAPMPPVLGPLSCS